MTVNPGFGGQKLIRRACGRSRTHARALDRAGSAAILEVDGGVNAQNAPELVRRGRDDARAGSALFGAPDAAEFIRSVKAL